MPESSTRAALKIPLILMIVALLVAAIWVIIFAGTENWGVPHGSGSTISADRPECPQHWGKIPIYPESGAVLNREPVAASSGPAFVASVGSGGLPVPGPVTDIPEFHDCQRFVDSTGAAYEALYAIFASYRLDSIVNTLGWEAVTWSSSNAAVATVSAGGVVTAVGVPGMAVITATSNVDVSRQASAAITVMPGAVAPARVAVSPGPPSSFSLAPGASVTLAPAIGLPTAQVLAAAQIYTYGRGYPALGIGPNFSCLFVFFDAQGQLSATMVHAPTLGPSITACEDRIDPLTTPGYRLSVMRTPVADSMDVPPVARWDFDPESGRYYIGLKCGLAWCEIGPREGFRPSRGFESVVATTDGEARVTRAKGWYDQQFLAVDNPGGQATPSRLLGTVLPDPDLADRSDDAYKGNWMPVAYVALQGADASGPKAAYKAKFNYDDAQVMAPFGRMNTISLCYGSRNACLVPAPPAGKGCGPDANFFGITIKRWWAQIASSSGQPAPMYRCVIRRSHDNLPSHLRIPATARWRWVAADETVWEYCPQGCCAVETDLTSPGWP